MVGSLEITKLLISLDENKNCNNSKITKRWRIIFKTKTKKMNQSRSHYIVIHTNKTVYL